MIQFMPEKLFAPDISAYFHIIVVVRTPLLYRQIQHMYTHTLKHTHSLFHGILRHYVYLQQSSLPSSLRSPASMYLRGNVLSLGVVDDLWYLPVLH